MEIINIVWQVLTKNMFIQPIDEVLLKTENPLLDISESNILADDISSLGEDHEDLFTHPVDVFPGVQIPIWDFIGRNYARRDEVAPSTDNHALFNNLTLPINHRVQIWMKH